MVACATLVDLFLVSGWRRWNVPFCQQITWEERYGAAVYSTNDLASRRLTDRTPIDESKNRSTGKNKCSGTTYDSGHSFRRARIKKKRKRRKRTISTPTVIERTPLACGGHSTRCNLLDPSVRFYFPAYFPRIVLFI